MITATLNVIRTCLRIGRQPLPRSLRWSILSSFLRVFVLGRVDLENRTARILNFEVAFLTLNSFSYVFHEIFTNLDYLFRTDRPAPVIVDCGSNIGMSILFFKTIYPNARIVAFEPDAETFACLRRNVEGNRLGDVVLHQSAISDSDNVVEFFSDPRTPGSLIMSLLPERIEGRSQMIEAVRLSRFIDDEIDFLKMDIEGAESRVIAELAKSGKLRRIKQMVVEYHHHIEAGVDRLAETLQVLEMSGFGYQIGASLMRPLNGGVFQDVLIYAYRKPEIGDERV